MTTSINDAKPNPFFTTQMRSPEGKVVQSEELPTYEAFQLLMSMPLEAVDNDKIVKCLMERVKPLKDPDAAEKKLNQLNFMEGRMMSEEFYFKVLRILKEKIQLLEEASALQKITVEEIESALNLDFFKDIPGYLHCLHKGLEEFVNAYNRALRAKSSESRWTAVDSSSEDLSRTLDAVATKSLRSLHNAVVFVFDTHVNYNINGMGNLYAVVDGLANGVQEGRMQRSKLIQRAVETYYKMGGHNSTLTFPLGEESQILHELTGRTYPQITALLQEAESHMLYDWMHNKHIHSYSGHKLVVAYVLHCLKVYEMIALFIKAIQTFESLDWKRACHEDDCKEYLETLRMEFRHSAMNDSIEGYFKSLPTVQKWDELLKKEDEAFFEDFSDAIEELGDDLISPPDIIPGLYEVKYLTEMERKGMIVRRFVGNMLKRAEQIGDRFDPVIHKGLVDGMSQLVTRLQTKMKEKSETEAASSSSSSR